MNILSVYFVQLFVLKRHTTRVLRLFYIYCTRFYFTIFRYCNFVILPELRLSFYYLTSNCNVDKSNRSSVIYNNIRITAFIFSSQQCLLFTFYDNLLLI